MLVFLGELIGIVLLIVFGGGVCVGVSLKKLFVKDLGWIVIIMGWGLVVVVVVYVVGLISGVYLNLVLMIGLVFKGVFLWSDVLGYIVV